MNHRMAGFMVSNDAAFIGAQDHRAAFLAEAHFVTSLFEFGKADLRNFLQRADNRGFIQDVREFRAGHADGGLRENIERVFRCVNRRLAAVRLENRTTAFRVGKRHENFAIETARAQERFVEIFRTIRRGDDDHAFGTIEAIHRGEQRVVRLLRFAVLVGLAVLAEAIDFVDENDGGLAGACLFEKFAHALGADADIDFIEITAARTEETGVRLAGDCFGEHGFAGAGRADQENSLRKISAETIVFRRFAQEIDYFLNLGFGFFDASDVSKTNGRAVANAMRTFAATKVRLVKQQENHKAGDNERRRQFQHAAARGGLRDVHTGIRSVEQRLDLAVGEVSRDREIHLRAAEAALVGTLDLVNIFVSLLGQLRRDNRFLVHQAFEPGAADLLNRCLRIRLPQQDERGDEGNDQNGQETFKFIRHYSNSLLLPMGLSRKRASAKWMLARAFSVSG